MGAEKPHALPENPLQSSMIGFWCEVSQKLAVGLLFFEKTITSEDYLNLKLNSLFCWNRINGIAGFGKMGPSPLLRTQQLSCGTR
jgi:hypothetical protein